MKNITIKSVEATISHKGESFAMCPTSNIKLSAKEKEIQGFKTICATMQIHKSLRGKSDLHGNPDA